MADDGYQTAWLQAERSASARRHIHELLLNLRLRHGIEQRRIVELGSGLGDNLALFADGNQVLGLEALADATEGARQRGIQTLHADLSIRPWPLPSQAWDWVLAIDVLEHLIDPLAALQSARDLLAPDGHLVVNLPNHFDWRSRWRMLRGGGIDSAGYFPQSPPWAYPHLRFFRHQEVLALLRAAELVLLEDLSCRQPTFPRARHWPRLARAVAASWPDAAAAGFFVIARRA